jgi:hypothetical protein
MASSSRKQSAVLCGDELGEYLHVSESEENLSDLEFDTDNELDDCALFDVVNGDSDKDDDIIQDFVWEDMNNYKGQRQNFMGSVGPQGAAKQVTEIVDFFQLFFNREFIDETVEETNRYAKQFLPGCKLSSRLTARSWKLVTEGELYVAVGLFMLVGTIKKSTLRSYFTTKKGISIPGFGDIIIRDKFKKNLQTFTCH